MNTVTQKKLHFYTGLLIILHFVITGQLLRFNYFGISKDDIMVRMMFRSNHIYILFSALLNLLVSFMIGDAKTLKLHSVAAVILITSTIALSISFYTDPITHSLQRDITRYAVYGCLGGTGLYLVLQARIKWFGLTT